MKIRHFFCEDVRTETTGKTTLIGLCPDDTWYLDIVDIVAEAKKDESEQKYMTTMDRAMLMLSISEFVGEVSIQIEILRPDGGQHGRFEDVGKVVCHENQCSNAIINLSGFPVPYAGVYIIKAMLNDFSYDIPLKLGNLQDRE